MIAIALDSPLLCRALTILALVVVAAAALSSACSTTTLHHASTSPELSSIPDRSYAQSSHPASRTLSGTRFQTAPERLISFCEEMIWLRLGLRPCPVRRDIYHRVGICTTILSIHLCLCRYYRCYHRRQEADGDDDDDSAEIPPQGHQILCSQSEEGQRGGVIGRRAQGTGDGRCRAILAIPDKGILVGGIGIWLAGLIEGAW
mmetsp:Transcript_26366/g.57150  ORF Transcript_26366/g.57150 Transcript_26366/m.57150 type:complete len:203 (+) Transcript_26366:259-867(+)